MFSQQHPGRRLARNCYVVYYDDVEVVIEILRGPLLRIHRETHEACIVTSLFSHCQASIDTEWMKLDADVSCSVISLGKSKCMSSLRDSRDKRSIHSKDRSNHVSSPFSEICTTHSFCVNTHIHQDQFPSARTHTSFG